MFEWLTYSMVSDMAAYPPDGEDPKDHLATHDWLETGRQPPELVAIEAVAKSLMELIDGERWLVSARFKQIRLGLTLTVEEFRRPETEVPRIQHGTLGVQLIVTREMLREIPADGFEWMLFQMAVVALGNVATLYRLPPPPLRNADRPPLQVGFEMQPAPPITSSEADLTAAYESMERDELIVAAPYQHEDEDDDAAFARRGTIDNFLEDRLGMISESSASGPLYVWTVSVPFLHRGVQSPE